jgi:3-polyprenyl-4-hydroxybenzoate decarboxylase
MKLGFDATRKVPGEDLDGCAIKPREQLPTHDQRQADITLARRIPGVLDASAPESIPGWLLIRADRDVDEPNYAGLGQRILAQLFTSKTTSRFIVVLGRDVNINDHHRALFHWVANCDASRDAIWDQSFECDRVGFDATPKTPEDARNNQPVRAWPPVLPGL